MQVIIPLLLSVMAGVLNITLAGSLKVMNCAPDILLGVILAASTYYGPLIGAFSGLLGGLVLDGILGPHMGMNATLYMLSAFLMGWLVRRNMNVLERLTVSSVWAAGTFLIKQLIGMFTVYFSGGIISLPMVFITYIVPATIYSTLFALMLGLLLGLVFNQPSLQPRWRRDIFRQSF